MILTDEEIQQAQDTVPFEDFIGSPEIARQKMAEYNDGCKRAIAKAQLKKVVEWLIDNDSVRGNQYDPWIINADLKQALLEEVK